MAVKRFTEEEMELLRKNPYTYRVTYNMLLLTVEFKEKFWKLYLQGFSPVSIFKELGYDPNILGLTE
ncbi:HTH domain-containing protein [Phascolarctobacterium succinatutens]|uniref:HTH domain-containing protein n=1 Tax=Phascolarctobacterium succinatutens TaxID=626940 RepID=UPI0023F43A03|nr:HTH domain-containing protein [Phascolarctobacterium succinatutens]